MPVPRRTRMLSSCTFWLISLCTSWALESGKLALSSYCKAGSAGGTRCGSVADVGAGRMAGPIWCMLQRQTSSSRKKCRSALTGRPSSPLPACQLTRRLGEAEPELLARHALRWTYKSASGAVDWHSEPLLLTADVDVSDEDESPLVLDVVGSVSLLEGAGCGLCGC